MQDKVSRAQSFSCLLLPSSCWHTSGLQGMSVRLPARAASSLRAFSRRHTPQTGLAQLPAPKQAAPSLSAHLAPFHVCFIPREPPLICVEPRKLLSLV